MARQLAVGKTISLDNQTRRQFIKLLGTGAIGTMGLSTVLEKVYGEKPEGKPLVITKDMRGKPKDIKIIPEKRYNIIKKFANISDRIPSHPNISTSQSRLVRTSAC